MDGVTSRRTGPTPVLAAVLVVVLVVLGDLIQQGVTQNDFSLTGAIIAISTIALLALLMSWASYLWPRAERLLEGEPRVIVRDDRILLFVAEALPTEDLAALIVSRLGPTFRPARVIAVGSMPIGTSGKPDDAALMETIA